MRHHLRGPPRRVRVVQIVRARLASEDPAVLLPCWPGEVGPIPIVPFPKMHVEVVHLFLCRWRDVWVAGQQVVEIGRSGLLRPDDQEVGQRTVFCFGICGLGYAFVFVAEGRELHLEVRDLSFLAREHTALFLYPLSCGFELLCLLLFGGATLECAAGRAEMYVEEDLDILG